MWASRANDRIRVIENIIPIPALVAGVSIGAIVTGLIFLTKLWYESL